MDMSPSAQRRLVEAGARARVEELLRAYPEVGPGEAAEILRFIKTAPPLELGLITTDEQLRAGLQQFRQDNASEFDLGLKEYLIAAIVVIALVVAYVLLWDMGVR